MNLKLVNGLTLSVAVQGDQSAAVALVFLPGPTDSWPSYRQVMENLPPSVRTIAVTSRGHGDSDKPEQGYRVEDFAADAVDVLDALDVGRAVVVGHSGSCLVARRVALDHPERVAGLVLEASPTTLRGHEGLQQLVAELEDLRDPIDETFARSFLLDSSTATLGEEYAGELIAEVRKVPAHVWRETFAGLQYDDTSELSRVAAPVLLIWGDADPIVGREMQEQLVSRLTNATLVIYEGLGHTPRWENPDRFAADLVAFYAGVI